MAVKTDTDLITQNDEIRNEVGLKANTKVRHANMNREIIDSKVNVGKLPANVDVDPASGVILNMNTKPIEHFKVTANITTPKNWTISNVTVAREFKVKVYLTADVLQTMPNNFIVGIATWIQADKTFSVTDSGIYILSGYFDGTTWYVSVAGPF